MSLIQIIGDVHGATDVYQESLQKNFVGQRTLQLGDMGIGFKGVPPICADVVGSEHKWFRGNHDDPAKCRASAGYIGDWGYLEEDSLFWVSGAFSIDRAWRTAGITWWPDEELSYAELQEAVELYAKVKPRFVVSHEAPHIASMYMLTFLMPGFRTEKTDCANSRTAQALQSMFEIHQPNEWIFGHYHVDKTFYLRGTKFTCVAPMRTYALETGTTNISMRET